jgi:hypothetical protein
MTNTIDVLWQMASNRGVIALVMLGVTIYAVTLFGAFKAEKILSTTFPPGYGRTQIESDHRTLFAVSESSALGGRTTLVTYRVLPWDSATGFVVSFDPATGFMQDFRPEYAANERRAPIH